MEDILTRCLVASGKKKASIVLKNANIVNVFTETIEKGDIAIEKGYIAGIGEYEGKIELDMTNKYISPGFIDGHMHIESSMVTPKVLGEYVIKSGTTTLIADPHEMVNVKGCDAMDWLLSAMEDTITDYYIMLPSSVPATKFETNGSDFTVEDIKKYINNNQVLGLGEVMCFNEVIDCKDVILKKIVTANNKISDGHAPNITGKELQAYAGTGIKTDHECTTYEEALEKIKAGMTILIREGSGAKNLEDIVLGIVKNNTPEENFIFCTDDKHLDDIEKEGHIRWNIKKAIKLGISPIKAIKMASYYTAKTYGIKNIGAIGPGYKADFVVLDNLKDFNILDVYKDGINIKEYGNGKKQQISSESNKLLNTVNLKKITSEDIKLRTYEKNVVIEIIGNQLLTKKVIEKIPGDNGIFIPNSNYSKLCVIERHKMTGNIGVSPLKGFKIKNGAIATSVAHDSHNIIVAGDNDRDMVIGVNRLREIQGGYVIVSDGKIVEELVLDLFGLISRATGEEVREKINKMLIVARGMGIPENIDPFITLSFLALPVIPEIRLTDMGIFDIIKNKFINEY